MASRLRRGIVALLAVMTAIVGLAAPGFAAGRGRPKSPPNVASGTYVALGDSYTAGPLIPPQADANCLRSGVDYPALVAATLHPAGFRDVSCSGSTTEDMAGTQAGWAGQLVPPEFNALGPGTTLVTLGIGGNDIGFLSVASTCAGLSLLNLFGAPCQAAYTVNGVDKEAALVATTGPKIAAVLRGIHARAPKAKVLVVGYPDILPLTGACWPFMPLAVGDVAWTRGIEEQLNAVLAAEAKAHNATYVDTYTPSIGHDACQILGPKWIEGLIPTLPAAPVHPNASGEAATAAAILATLGR